MPRYTLPETASPLPVDKREAILIANGDLRLSANQSCWPAQRDTEARIATALKREGWKCRRGHPYKRKERHGFIGSQKEGMEVFTSIHPDAPLAYAKWSFS